MLNGVLLVNKPKGLTSHDVVARIRRILKMKAVGHAGTLDPFATGLLVILLGEGTKISNEFRDADKAYQVKAELGYTTDSWDNTGEVVSENREYDISVEELKEEVFKHVGALELKVPIYSAIKQKGKKLYELAREGVEVDAPTRTMNFYDLKWIEGDSHTFEVYFRCSKGSYVRSWVNTIGEKLGMGATAVELKRTSSSPFELSEALELDDLENLKDECEGIDLLHKQVGEMESFKSLNQALTGFLGLTVTGKDLKLLRNGQISYALDERLVFEQKEAQKSGEELTMRILDGHTGELVGLIEIPALGKLKIKRIFNT
ncbi:MAG: tRNA pseudouridine(55) synthase TruB [Bdellovibrionaceae bacterium]|nr:tRNA pseudouridine(55) synthase TruB [Pseudobdellovibrionaceae bacterium]